MATARTTVKKKHGLVEQMESRMMREIRQAPSLSRLALSKRLRISPSTSGIYVDRLIEDGYLIQEERAGGLGKRSRGRPEVLLRPSPSGGYFIGAEFEAGVIHAVCLDFAENPVASTTRKLTSAMNADGLLAELEQTIAEVMPSPGKRVHGIGVGVPGLVDVGRGVALNYPHVQGWNNIPVASKLSARFHVPVHLDNNARTAAMAHRRQGGKPLQENFVCLMIRSGIGAGIIHDGDRWPGQHNIAGEVGRIRGYSLPPAATDTPAEQAEQSASVRDILQYVHRGLDNHPASLLQPHRKDLTIQHVIHAVNEGDLLAREAVLNATRKIAWLCHVLSLVIDPEAIIIAGPLIHLGDWLLKETRAEMQRYHTIPAQLLPRLELSTMGEDAGAYGAASLVVDSWKPNRRRKASSLAR